jgi:hypothetical protein
MNTSAKGIQLQLNGFIMQPFCQCNVNGLGVNNIHGDKTLEYLKENFISEKS